MVFQNGALFDSLSVGENVALLRCVNAMIWMRNRFTRLLMALLDMVGVKPMRDLLPSDLSTGMKRSVAIARTGQRNRSAFFMTSPPPWWTR